MGLSWEEEEDEGVRRCLRDEKKESAAVNWERSSEGRTPHSERKEVTRINSVQKAYAEARSPYEEFSGEKRRSRTRQDVK